MYIPKCIGEKFVIAVVVLRSKYQLSRDLRYVFKRTFRCHAPDESNRPLRIKVQGASGDGRVETIPAKIGTGWHVAGVDTSARRQMNEPASRSGTASNDGSQKQPVTSIGLPRQNCT